MKGYFRILFFALLLISLSFTASAHPGQTDGNGGHTNHSNGEYHYHHGYPQHAHYDIDDDGIIDCPYDFKVSDSSVAIYSTIPDKVDTQQNSNQENSNIYFVLSFFSPIILIPLFHLSDYFERLHLKALATGSIYIFFVLWLITFPVSSVPVLIYFDRLKKKHQKHSH